MRLSGEPVGRWGIALLVVTGVAGLLLGWHGWTTRSAVAPSLAGAASSAVRPGASATSAAAAPATATAGPATAGPATTNPATARPSASAGPAKPGPKLSSEPYASFAFQVWPGTLTNAAHLAMTGLSVTVRKQGNGLLVTAGVIGQPASPPHLYASGARVYVVEASLGDDSGSADYNLGDDGLVVTDAQQRILQ